MPSRPPLPSVSRLLRLAVAAAGRVSALVAPAALAGGPGHDPRRLRGRRPLARSRQVEVGHDPAPPRRLPRRPRLERLARRADARRPTTELTTLKNVAAAANLAASVSTSPSTTPARKTTPLAPESRAQFAQYAAAIVKAVPTISDVIVGNEPNLNRFWQPQFGPTASTRRRRRTCTLLTETYDALKARLAGHARLRRRARAARHDTPGRPRHPLADGVPARPRQGVPRERPDDAGDGRALDPPVRRELEHVAGRPPSAREHDRARRLRKLVALLGTAFDGTGQPGSTLPILYDELRRRDARARRRRRSSTRAQSRRRRGPSTRRRRPPSTAVRSSSRSASRPSRACCSATPRTSRRSWAGSPASSTPTGRRRRASRRQGRAACDARWLDRPLPRDGAAVRLRLVRFPFGSGLKAPALSFRLRCELDCVFRARLVKLPRGATTLAANGRAAAGVRRAPCSRSEKSPPAVIGSWSPSATRSTRACRSSATSTPFRLPASALPSLRLLAAAAVVLLVLAAAPKSIRAGAETTRSSPASPTTPSASRSAARRSMTQLADAGFDAVRITSDLAPGRDRPAPPTSWRRCAGRRRGAKRRRARLPQRLPAGSATTPLTEVARGAVRLVRRRDRARRARRSAT